MSNLVCTPNQTLGVWHPGEEPIATEASQLRSALYRLDTPIFALENDGRIALASGGEAVLGSTGDGQKILAFAPAGTPESLGDSNFCKDHGMRFAYVSGAMANGIGSADICEEMGRAGMLGFFGAAGLHPSKVEEAIERLQASMGDKPYGFNLIHSPNEPDLEAGVADLFIRKGVRLVEASAYMDLTLPIVRYRLQGIRRGADGSIETPNQVVAKVSRIEVASKFFAPPPEKFLKELVASGDITSEQAELAAQIPVAQDITAEADSGGHTDNRPMVTLLPTLIALRDRMQAQYGYAKCLRVGVGGGISTPSSAAAAYAMGAAYAVVGSVHQSCVESGSSDVVREMLAECGQADITMAPAADMFEMGVQVQVLKRGTMFAMRGGKLYDLYRTYPSLDAIPEAERKRLETQIFKAPLSDVWASTRAFFEQRDPTQVTKAEANPKHKMALVFRSYLGQASRWANAGEPTRRVDYQVWCGPAMGAFNEWVKGSELEQPKNRRVADVAKNILLGAAVQTRLNILSSQGVNFSSETSRVSPVDASTLKEHF
jgi:PfaD family protein